MTSSGLVSEDVAASVRVATYLEPAQQPGPCVSVVRVGKVYVVAAGALQEIGVQREPEHPFVPARPRIVAFGDGERRHDRARRRIHADDSSPCAFAHPEMIVRPPHHFPRRPQSARHDAERERRLRGDIQKKDLRQCDDDAEGAGHGWWLVVGG